MVINKIGLIILTLFTIILMTNADITVPDAPFTATDTSVECNSDTPIRGMIRSSCGTKLCRNYPYNDNGDLYFGIKCADVTQPKYKNFQKAIDNLQCTYVNSTNALASASTGKPELGGECAGDEGADKKARYLYCAQLCDKVKDEGSEAVYRPYFCNLPAIAYGCVCVIVDEGAYGDTELCPAIPEPEPEPETTPTPPKTKKPKSKKPKPVIAIGGEKCFADKQLISGLLCVVQFVLLKISNLLRSIGL